MPHKEHRILMATDVPFWRAEDGAQQRMASLVRFLHGSGCRIRVFYLGDLEAKDRLCIENQQLDISAQSSNRPPSSFFERAVWWANATSYKIRTTLGMINRSPFDTNRSLTLKDFDWPWARTRFGKEVEQFGPDTILIEYVKMAYLIDALSQQQRSKIHCVIDTHDVLHVRMQQFIEAGHDHWLNISREEESQMLALCDTIVAIQPHEAGLLREMAPTQRVITCGHSSEPFPEFNNTAEDSKKIRVGFLASKNAANEAALKQLLRLSKQLSDQFQLVIGGSVCDNLHIHSQSSAHRSASEQTADQNNPHKTAEVKSVGQVETLALFYDQIDVAINLVQFGSGLKIKNVEALSYGKPLITTEHGIEGMPGSESAAIFVSDSLDEIAAFLDGLSGQRERLARIQSEAFQFAQSEYSDSRAYDELMSCINATC